MKKTIKISAILIAMVLMLTAICNHGVAEAAKAVKIGNGMYTVTSEKKKEARFDKVSQKSVTSLTIPATVKIGKKTYKVTAIKANALKNNKNIQKIAIGKNVKKIAKNSFYGCKNLKSVNIKTTKLTLKSVGKNAFKGLNSKVKIKVPASKLAAYRKLLKARGVTGKNQKITDGNTNTSKGPVDVPYETKEIETRFGIGNIKTEMAKWNQKWDTVSREAVATNPVPITMAIDMPLEVYGKWTVKKNTVDLCHECCSCGDVSSRLWFDNSDDLHEHFAQTGHSHYITHNGTKTINVMHWVQDENPCKLQFRAELPEGFNYVGDNKRVKMSYRGEVYISNKDYTIDVSGRTVTITINNVKSYLKLHDLYSGHSNPLNLTRAFVLTFNANMTNTAASVNNVTASISYGHKGVQKDFNLGTASVLSSTIKINNVDETGNALTGVDLKLYKKQDGEYTEVGSQVSSSLYTFGGIGAGEYKLVQYQVPEGYRKTNVLGVIFIIKASAIGNSFTELKVLDNNGNERNLTGGVWNTDLTNATLSTDYVTYRKK